jgi:hypothetical protein
MSRTIDRHMLEPQVVAVRIDRNWPAVRHDEVHQFDELVAQLQPRAIPPRRTPNTPNRRS